MALSFHDIIQTVERCMGNLEWYDWTMEELIKKCGRSTLGNFSQILWRSERPNVIDVAQSEESSLVVLSVLLVPEQSMLWTVVDSEFKRNIMHWYSVRPTLEESMANIAIGKMFVGRVFCFMDYACGKHYTLDSMGNSVGHLLCYRRNAVGINMIVRPYGAYYFKFKPMFDALHHDTKPFKWIETANVHGMTPLHVIIRATPVPGRLDFHIAATLLGTRMVDIDYPLRISKGTCMHMALLHNKPDIFFLCLYFGGDLGMRTCTGDTPLDLVRRLYPGNDSVVKNFLDKVLTI